MKTYVLYIHDDRYSVPTMDTITLGSEARVRELAAERLASSPHYSVVELWEGDCMLERRQKSSAA